MTLIADIFPKLGTQKNLATSMPKKSPFKGSFEKPHGKCAQTLLKCQGQFFAVFIDHCEGYYLTKSLW